MIIGLTTAGDTLSLLDIMNSAHTFYNDAWGNLITFLSIAGGAIVIVIPILLALWQKSQIELQKKDLINSFSEILDKRSAELQNDKEAAISYLESKLEGLKCQLVSTGDEIEERNRLALTKQEELVTAKINEDFALKMKDMEKRIAEVKAEAIGAIFLLQGNMSGINLVSKLKNHCKAISEFSVSKNMGTILTLLQSNIRCLKIIAKNKDVSIQSIIPLLDQIPSFIEHMENNAELMKIIPDFEQRLVEVKEMLEAETTPSPETPQTTS